MLTPEIKDCVDELFTPRAETLLNDAGSVYEYRPHKMLAIVVRTTPPCHYSVDLIFNCIFIITPLVKYMASCIAQVDVFATVASDEKYNGALPAPRWREIAVEMGLEVLSNNRVANIFCYVLSCASRSHMVI